MSILFIFIDYFTMYFCNTCFLFVFSMASDGLVQDILFCQAKLTGLMTSLSNELRCFFNYITLYLYCIFVYDVFKIQICF
jgi:hypothetical protein